MSFVFKPLTEKEEEDNRNNRGSNNNELLPAGDYVFDISRCDNSVSKTGNSMAKLILTVWPADNATPYTVYDYLVFTDAFLNRKKVKDFSIAIGLADDHAKGKLPSELGGYSGMVRLGVQDKQPKDTGGFYPPKNIVLEYLVSDMQHKRGTTAAAKDLNNDVPF